MMIERALAEFGHRMGLEGFALDANGLAGLDVSGLGRLYLERVVDTDEEILIYVARKVPSHDREIFRVSLELCDYRHGHPFPLLAGRHGDHLLLLTRLRADRLTAAALENAVHFLSGMSERLFSRSL